MTENNTIHSTTIVSVRRGNCVAIAGDGQATMGNTVAKANVKKIRRLYKNKILAGFAGATADAFMLFELFEAKLEESEGNLVKAAVELVKKWRTDRSMYRLEAMLIVADEKKTLIISGSGDVLELQDDIAAIGSGGSYALAAAKALFYNTELSASEIVKKSLEIAADICIYTNHNIVIDQLGEDVND